MLDGDTNYSSAVNFFLVVVFGCWNVYQGFANVDRVVRVEEAVWKWRDEFENGGIVIACNIFAIQLACITYNNNNIVEVIMIK